MLIKVEPTESTLNLSQGNETSMPALSDELYTFISKLLSATPEPENLDHGAATGTWLPWLEAYASRINDDRSEWSEVPDDMIDDARKAEMLGVNPRFVLRQWVLEDVIKRVERDHEGGKRVLAKVMHVRPSPFREHEIVAIILHSHRWHAILLSLGVQRILKIQKRGSARKKRQSAGTVD